MNVFSCKTKIISGPGSVAALGKMGIHGAIIGKAYYIGAIDLKTAIEVAL